MREVLRVSEDVLYDFDIPNDFNYKGYQSTMRTLASLYYGQSTEVNEFVETFSTDMLTMRDQKKYFSKRKTNAFCQSHSLENFQKILGGFINAVQRAVSCV